MSNLLLHDGTLTNFTRKELACRHCGMLNYHPGFLEKLQAVRIEYGKPMEPSSGCRCIVHNRNIGGHSSSSHICDVLPHASKGQLGAFGVDIIVTDNHQRGVLSFLFWKHGFAVGHNYAKRFIHADMRIWFGMSQQMFPY